MLLTNALVLCAATAANAAAQDTSRTLIGTLRFEGMDRRQRLLCFGVGSTLTRCDQNADVHLSLFRTKDGFGLSCGSYYNPPTEREQKTIFTFGQKLQMYTECGCYHPTSRENYGQFFTIMNEDSETMCFRFSKPTHTEDF